MTRFIHDQLAKGILEETLSLHGTVQVEVQLPAEIQRIDLLFTPTDAPAPPILGLLGQLATAPTPTLFEPFRKAVTLEQVWDCQRKLLGLIADRQRQARRDKIALAPAQLPFLWILTPTVSAALRETFGATSKPEHWPPGVYLLPTAQRTGIIAIHQLPRQPDTLWLRLLGRDRVQHDAVVELQRLPTGSFLRERVLELVYDALAMVELRHRQAEDLDLEERTFFMQLSGAFQQRLAEEKQLGRQEGRQEGEVNLVLRQLARRVGSLAPEIEMWIRGLSLAQIEALGEELLEFSNVNDLTIWLKQMKIGDD